MDEEMLLGISQSNHVMLGSPLWSRCALRRSAHRQYGNSKNVENPDDDIKLLMIWHAPHFNLGS
jgi:hypothetical protein